MTIASAGGLARRYDDGVVVGQGMGRRRGRARGRGRGGGGAGGSCPFSQAAPCPRNEKSSSSPCDASSCDTRAGGDGDAPDAARGPTGHRRRGCDGRRRGRRRRRRRQRSAEPRALGGASLAGAAAAHPLWHRLLLRRARAIAPRLPAPGGKRPAAAQHRRPPPPDCSLSPGRRRRRTSHVARRTSHVAGAGDPPRHGDYEAQRHWMEVALHTPAASWYTDGPHNRPGHWPLDYPPLSGLQSWACGKARRAGARPRWPPPFAAGRRQSRAGRRRRRRRLTPPGAAVARPAPRWRHRCCSWWSRRRWRWASRPATRAGRPSARCAGRSSPATARARRGWGRRRRRRRRGRRGEGPRGLWGGAAHRASLG